MRQSGYFHQCRRRYRSRARVRDYRPAVAAYLCSERRGDVLHVSRGNPRIANAKCRGNRQLRFDLGGRGQRWSRSLRGHQGCCSPVGWMEEALWSTGVSHAVGGAGRRERGSNVESGATRTSNSSSVRWPGSILDHWLSTSCLTVLSRASAGLGRCVATGRCPAISHCTRQHRLRRLGLVARLEIVIRLCAADSEETRKSPNLNTKLVG